MLTIAKEMIAPDLLPRLLERIPATVSSPLGVSSSTMPTRREFVDHHAGSKEKASPTLPPHAKAMLTIANAMIAPDLLPRLLQQHHSCDCITASRRIYIDHANPPHLRYHHAGSKEKAAPTLPPPAKSNRIQVYHKQLFSASYLNLSWSSLATVLDVQRRLHQLRSHGCDSPLQHVAITFKGKILGDDEMTLREVGICNSNVLYFFLNNNGERSDLPL
jgi:hypothetical protein